MTTFRIIIMGIGLGLVTGSDCPEDGGSGSGLPYCSQVPGAGGDCDGVGNKAGCESYGYGCKWIKCQGDDRGGVCVVVEANL